MGSTQPDKAVTGAIAAAFRAARQAHGSLDGFPGSLPVSLAHAYAVQDEAIAQWPDKVGGWKVAGIAPEFRAPLGAERISGPAFAADIRLAGAVPVPFGIFPRGFAAIEAEFIFRMARDVPPRAADDPALLMGCIGALHAGMETAGSPFAGINGLGPLSVVSDFGNNFGLIVGAGIAGWQDRPLESLISRAFVNDRCVGEGSAAKVAGGPLAALRFLITHLAARGFALNAGDYVSTGMTTGIHDVRVGDHVRLEFCDGIAFEAVAGDAGKSGNSYAYLQSP